MRGKWPGLQAHVVQPESMDRQASCRPSPGERSPQAEDTVPLLQTRSQAVSLWTPFSTLWPFIQLRSQRIPMLVQTMVLGLVSEKESQTPSTISGNRSWWVAIRARRCLRRGEADQHALSQGLYAPDLTHVYIRSVPYLPPMLIR